MKSKKLAVSLILAPMFFLSACGQPKSSNNPAQSAPGEIVEKPDPSSQATEADLALAKEVQNLFKMNQKADQIFSEVWAVYWQDRSQKLDNVFKVLNQALATSYDHDGHLLKSENEENNDRKESQEKFELVKKTIKDKVYFQVVQNSSDGKEQSGNKIIAVISKGADKFGEFYLIDYERDAVWLGASLATLENLRSACKLYLGTERNLKAMQCQNLGQNRTKTGYLIFKNLIWNPSSTAKSLFVKGVKKKVTENADLVVESEFTMSENALENTILIQEKETAKEAKTRQVKGSINAETNSDQQNVEHNESQFQDQNFQQQGATASGALTEDASMTGAAHVGQIASSPTAAEIQGQASGVLSGDMIVDPSRIDQDGQIIPIEELSDEAVEESSQEPPTVR